MMSLFVGTLNAIYLVQQQREGRFRHLMAITIQFK